MRTVRRTAAAAVLVVLAACSAAPSEEAADPPSPGATAGPGTASPAPAEPPAEPPADGPDAPDAPPRELLAFTGRQLDGGTFDGAAVTGDVVVWFWAPW